MKRLLFLLVLALIAAAYLAGYLPEHRRLAQAQQSLQAAEAQLADVQNRLRLYTLESRLTRLIETVGARNFGDAATLSSGFFDAVRAEIGLTANDQVKTALEAVLTLRDPVTSRLAMSDATVLDLLQQAMSRIRQLTQDSPAPSQAP